MRINFSTNEKIPIWNANLRITFFAIGLTTLLFGIMFYFYLRPQPVAFTWISGWLDLKLPQRFSMASQAMNPLMFSLPSFLHIIAFCFLSMSVVKLTSSNFIKIGIGWLIVSSAFEFLQVLDHVTFPIYLSPWLSSNGTFDWLDLYAAVLGVVVFLVLSKWLSVRGSVQRKHENHIVSPMLKSMQYSLIPIFMIGIVSIIGSVSACDSDTDVQGRRCTTDYVMVDPVYMSYEELRTTAIVVDPDRPFIDSGKIYLYNDYIFINSPNEGIHIYDNSNPLLPKKVTFINIPGNIDIAISNGHLYVDSYIDLVTIDITNINSPVVVNRQINIFPYDPYQNVSNNVYFTNIDKRNGVVVGYKEK